MIGILFFDFIVNHTNYFSGPTAPRTLIPMEWDDGTPIEFDDGTKIEW